MKNRTLGKVNLLGNEEDDIMTDHYTENIKRKVIARSMQSIIGDLALKADYLKEDIEVQKRQYSIKIQSQTSQVLKLRSIVLKYMDIYMTHLLQMDFIVTRTQYIGTQLSQFGRTNNNPSK
jgi:hypothetical protein